MGKHLLLDCTLRDGGYINDWNFGRNTLTSVFSRLVRAGVDIIEVGFLDDRRMFDENRSIAPDTASFGKIFGKIEKGDAIVVGMIDYGTCRIEHLQPCDESYLDGIRVIFKKNIRHEAIYFCRQVKELGYKVFVQAVSITSYDDDELFDLVSQVNDLKPYALSMVDTYGLLHKNGLMHIFQRFDEYLDPDICIGYHAHNNFQLGYANSIEVLGTAVKRNLVVDATLYGMGKSAGNTPIELMAMYMNENLGKRYDISQMMEAIETNLLSIYHETPWGYNLFYYISGVNKCHPNYVSYLLNKRTLSIRAINDILLLLQGDDKLLYNQQLIEQLYLQHQRNDCDDTESLLALRGELAGRDVLLLGPGRSIDEQKDCVHAYATGKELAVISISFIPASFENCIDYLFLTNNKRYSQMATALTELPKSMKMISMSNVLDMQNDFRFVLNYSSWIDPNTDIPDNSLVMALRVLSAVGVRSIALAGFDGYVKDNMNYYITNMEYSFAKEKAEYLNHYIRCSLEQIREKTALHFVTPSVYQEV